MSADNINDLFQGATPAAKAAVTVAPAMPAVQYVRSPCECGAGGGWRMVGHYDVLRCQCGREFWALRPRRSGPLVAFPWPGVVARPAYYEERAAA